MTDRLGPYLLGPNDTPENGIYTGDARELAKAIPGESVDLIFTDPVYDRIEDYEWLAQMAAGALKLDGACLAWVANTLPDALEAMRRHLLFYTILTLFRSGVNVGGFYRGLRIKSSHILLMERGEFKPHSLVWDTGIGVSRPSRYPKVHKWAKDPEALRRWIAAFCNDGAVIFDPFTGGGTVPAVCKQLGRRYLAFEIDPEVAETARQRVRETQPPLFVLEPEQMSLGFA